jgi:ParB family chromosome partitioning protein
MTALASIPREKSAAAAEPEPPAPSFEQIRVDQVDVGENIRIQPGELDDMAASILEHGVLSPVKVVGPHKDGRYKLVYGQRRLLASRQANLLLIPAIVVPAGADVDHPGAKRSIEQLVENLQRADLNPIDEAKALRQVLDADPELTQDELAKRLGRSAPWVSNTLRLLEVSPVVQALVADGKLSASHVKAIAGLSSEQKQQEIAERAVQYDYSAKRVEQDVAWAKQPDRSDVDSKEQRKKKGERLAKKMVKVLETAGIPKDAALLLGGMWEVDEATVQKAIKAAGYNAGDRQTFGRYGYEPDKIGCNCQAFEWTTYPSPMFKRVCIDKAHVDAYQAKEEAGEQQRKKELRDKAKRLTAVLERGLAGIDATTARLAIAAIFGSNLTYQLGQKGDAWAALEAITDDALPHELAELLASRLIPVDRWDRVDDSAGLAAAVNKLAAAPAKKAA